MYKINSIKFKNFKAFYGEETLKLDGNHLLVYGENGSGKSSVFWGLYTFLQSSGKSLLDTTKYFQHYDETLPATFESLKNIYAAIDEDAYIEVETIDEHGVKTINRIGKDTSNTHTPIIAIANASSDFINYKLLHNFYTVTHKQDINLWQVFNRDIFPYFRNLESEPYFRDSIDLFTSGVPMSSGGVKVASGSTRTIFESNLQNLNDQIALFIGQIEQNANTFLRENFNDNKDILKINLRYNVPIDYNSIRHNRKSEYSISLVLETRQNETEPWRKIPRPHSFFNEAQLTRIAISVRIGALLTRVNDRKYQILCLDDMLISLDMGNRDKVIQLVLNTEKKTELAFFDKFQKLIFTHDKTFYNLCKQRINLSGNIKDWHFKEIYLDTDVTPQRPFIDNSTDYFERAKKHLKAFDYPASANALRQGLENLIFNFLPDNDKLQLDKTDKTTSGKQFNDLLDKLKQIHKENRVSTTIIDNLFVFKDHLLNPFSHDNLYTQVYKEEIESLFLLIPSLKVLNSELLKEAKNKDSIIKLIDINADGEKITYEIFIKENLKRYTLLDGNKYFSKCEVIVLKEIKEDETELPLNNVYVNFKTCINRLASFLGKTYASDDEILSKLDFS